MKKLIIGLFVIGFTSLGYSQNTEGEAKQVELTGVTISALLNSSYLDKVQDGTFSPRVIALENEAARFDVTKSSGFDRRFEVYKVIFKKPNGHIIAAYDGTGKIVSSIEEFKNIQLPPAVYNSVFKENPGWALQSNVYLVSYDHYKGVKKNYQLQMGKDNSNKSKWINIEENILN